MRDIKKKNAQGVDQNFSVKEEQKTAITSASYSVQAVFYEPSSPKNQHQKALKKSKKMLDRLDDLRLLDLSQIDNADVLQDLQSMMAQQDDSSGDPHLDDLKLEIETRVMVELAKRGR